MHHSAGGSIGGLFDSNLALFDYLFDTNSVRDFARRIKSEVEWKKLRAVWKEKRHKTAWIPWTIGELLGTNLAGAITEKDCKEVAIAVRRFDQIACRDILCGPRALLKWSINRFLGHNTQLTFEDKHRESLENAKTLETPAQVNVRVLDSRTTYVQIQNPETKKWVGQTIPSDFTMNSAARANDWKTRLEAMQIKTEFNENDIVDKMPYLMALLKVTPHNIVALAKDLGFSDAGLIGFSEKTVESTLNQPFVFGPMLQDWYSILRVISVKTGKIRETTGRDLAISNYIPLSKVFVTSDNDFATMIRDVFPVNVISFDEFVSLS